MKTQPRWNKSFVSMQIFCLSLVFKKPFFLSNSLLNDLSYLSYRISVFPDLYHLGLSESKTWLQELTVTHDVLSKALLYPDKSNGRSRMSQNYSNWKWISR